MKFLNTLLLFNILSGCILFQSRDDKIIERFDSNIPVPVVEEDYKIWEKYKKNIENEKLDIKKVRILIFKLNKAIIEKDFDLFFSLFQEKFSLKWYYSGADLRKEELRSIFNEFNSFPESKINSLASKMTPRDICENPIPNNGMVDFYRYLFYSKKIIWKSTFTRNKFIQYDSYRMILP